MHQQKRMQRSTVLSGKTTESRSRGRRKLGGQHKGSLREPSESSDAETEEQQSEVRPNRRAEKMDSMRYYNINRSTLMTPLPDAQSLASSCVSLREEFATELEKNRPQQLSSLSQQLLATCIRSSGHVDVTSKEEFKAKPTRSRHRFSRVRPLHVCAAHSFVCFRNNGDLLAATPHSVLVYDRPPAACELSYKEPLYSIVISGVSLAADLSDSHILVLRQGSYLASEERAADELLVAQVATGETQLMAKIAMPQYSIVRHIAGDHLMLQEKSSRRDSAVCRGMQVNQIEHKVYLLYDYHLLVMDLDMELEPLVIRLRCRGDELGPAVALMEFDHAVYVLTASSHLLASTKHCLFNRGPGSCCLPVLQRLDSQLAAREIRSCVVDRRQATAFFSVPRGCKLISLTFAVPANDSRSARTAAVAVLPMLQERLYATANCSVGAASVPCAMAWDATTEHLLVLEWGSENNGVLITVDFWPDDETIRAAGGNRHEDTEGRRGSNAQSQQQQQRYSERLTIVKNFGIQMLNSPTQRLN